MATITPVDSRLGPGVDLVTWTTITEADTAAGYLSGSLYPLVGALQVTGTFGGATVVLVPCRLPVLLGVLRSYYKVLTTIQTGWT